MWKRIKKLFINEEHSGHLVEKTLSRDELLRNMKYPKDIHLKTYSNEKITGTCNFCGSEVHILIQEALVWYLCPKCNLTSFNAIENFHRDVELASELGGVIEQDIYYFRELPEGLNPPSIN